MRQQAPHRLIYKLHTKQLKRANWNLELPLERAMRECPDCVVAINDSQALRFIDEINGAEDIHGKINHIKRSIKAEKKKPRSRETKVVIKRLYAVLYELQFQKDYICIIMDSNRDYDRANQGFSINGIRYRRFLGTNGGIKNSTVVYVNESVYPELKRRLDNGRNENKPIVPAKLEAYQALICSGSTPIPEPHGVIVVKDCITRFTENVILIDDSNEGEPKLTYEDDYTFEHNNSDGYGFMTPEYSRKVNGWLNGDDEHTLSGFNSRGSWLKGMVYTFDFVEFAEKVAGSYIVTDVWGQPRDVRDAEIILTESMLKLWDSYDSWEDYKENCDKNGYRLCAAKTTPDRLENVRDTNYQYLQDISLTDSDIEELCGQTFDEINGVLGMDYRKALTFMSGFSLTDDSFDLQSFNPAIQALMIEPMLLNDSYVRKRIWNMIERRVTMAKRGAIRVNGNYAMISGDPYALCQSMFGLEVTGLLRAGEVYHKYWIDKGSDEILCFRSPMTCANNIRKMRLRKTEDVLHWYRYITTVLIYNAWDSSCEAMNGSDFDGDSNMCTDDAVLLRRVRNLPTIVCMQRKSEKKAQITEEDIIASNKLAFNDDIGIVTNYVTSMIERRGGFREDSQEYATLTYRIMCGQHFQQGCIDRIKGVIVKPMPSYWYSYRDCIGRDTDNDDVKRQKRFNRKIVASEKPYFMCYVYPGLRSQYNTYIRNSRNKLIRLFHKYGIDTIEALRGHKRKTKQMADFMKYYDSHMVVGNNPCTVNRICWFAEKQFPNLSGVNAPSAGFDYNLLKCGADYSRKLYNDIFAVYMDYKEQAGKRAVAASVEKTNKDIDHDAKEVFYQWFSKKYFEVCPDEKMLCDILLDICYQTETEKAFVWEICGDVIVRNLLSKHNGVVNYPCAAEDGGCTFEYAGHKMTMRSKVVNCD